MVHKIRGKVVRGNSIGRKLGFPTANIPVAAEMPVQDGVYAAWAGHFTGPWSI